jgi:hypothetical protein
MSYQLCECGRHPWLSESHLPRCNVAITSSTVSVLGCYETLHWWLEAAQAKSANPRRQPCQAPSETLQGCPPCPLSASAAFSRLWHSRTCRFTPAVTASIVTCLLPQVSLSLHSIFFLEGLSPAGLGPLN